jgi:hypothetical protein
MGEFQPYQVVAIRMRHPQRPGAESACCLGQGVRRSQRRAWDFEQNLRGERQRAADRHQSTPGRDIQCSGKLQQIFALFVAATNENRDSDGEARPLTPLCFGIRCTLQTDPFRREIAAVPHLGGQTTPHGNVICGNKPVKLPVIPYKSAAEPLPPPNLFLLLFTYSPAFNLEL